MSKHRQLSIIAAVLILALATLACNTYFVPFHSSNTVTLTGNVITETRSVSGFDRVEVSTLGELTIIQGDTESLVIETDDALMPYIETKVTNNKLTIGFKNNVSINFSNNGIHPTLHVTLTVKDLRDLDVSGLAEVNCDSLQTAELSIDLSGAGHITVDSLAVITLSVDISGLGGVTLAGTATDQYINISGAGGYQGGDLESATTTISLSGLGGATVWVTGSLEVDISGAGGVNYYGNPTITQDVSGLGRLHALGEH